MDVLAAEKAFLRCIQLKLSPERCSFRPCDLCI
jgi:hypothetical protein